MNVFPSHISSYYIHFSVYTSPTVGTVGFDTTMCVVSSSVLSRVLSRSCVCVSTFPIMNIRVGVKSDTDVKSYISVRWTKNTPTQTNILLTMSYFSHAHLSVISITRALTSHRSFFFSNLFTKKCHGMVRP